MLCTGDTEDRCSKTIQTAEHEAMLYLRDELLRHFGPEPYVFLSFSYIFY